MLSPLVCLEARCRQGAMILSSRQIFGIVARRVLWRPLSIMSPCVCLEARKRQGPRARMSQRVSLSPPGVDLL